MEGTLAEIRMFAGNFAPRGWAFCQGQLFSIAQNTALFSLLGTTYGGNGQTTFALPDLRGRCPVGAGQGPGISSIVLGEVAGTETVTLLTTQMPAHTHTAVATITGTVTPQCFADEGLGDDPTGSYMAVSSASNRIFTNNTQAPDANMGSSPISATANITIGIAGSSQPVAIRNPYLGMNYIICTQGFFPVRN